MPQTARVFWEAVRGRAQLNFNWGAIEHDSIVLISASEFAPDAIDPEGSPRFIGAASIRVQSVAPHGPPTDPNQGVTFAVDVDWPEPLHVVTDITVLDGPPEVTQVQ